MAVKTNSGGKWLVPIVRSLVMDGDEVLCCVADEEGGLDQALSSVGATTMRSAALGGSGIVAAARSFPALVRRVRAFAPDVLNYHLYRTALVFRLVSLFVPRARRVHAVPGPLFLEQRLVRWVERVLARRDDVIICTSDAVRRLYRDIGYPDARLVTAAYPVDLGAWSVVSSDERLAARLDLGIDPHSFVAVMVAYYYAPRRWVLGGRSVKGHEVALAAWTEFRRRGGEGILLLVGGGFGEAGIRYRQSVLESFGAFNDPSIRIVESVDSVRPFYAAADVSLAPSRSENLGSAAEASALGIPTIASDVGGLPELVRPGLSGWLVHPDDPSGLADALRLAADGSRKGELSMMKRSARQAAEEVVSAPLVLPEWHAAFRGEELAVPSEVGSVPKLCFVVSSPMTVDAFLRPLIERLAERFEVTVVANGVAQGSIRPFDVPVRFFDVSIERSISPAADLKALRELAVLFRREAFSIVHSVTPKAGLLAALAGRHCSVPLRVHTFTGQVWATRHGAQRALLRAADRLIASSCNQVLVDSPSQRDFLVNEGVVKRSRAHVLGDGSISGVDINRFKPDEVARADVRFQLRIAEASKVLLFVGRLTREKGVLDLVAAFALLAQRRTDLHLVLVGPDEERLESKARELLGDEGSRFHCIVDWVNEPERYFAAADIFCLPSYREGFGSTVLEAAACGLPAVASRIYGLTDAVQEGETGLLHRPGDVQEIASAVDDLLSNEQLRTEMGARARLRAQQKFSSSELASLQVAFYERLMTRDSSS